MKRKINANVVPPVEMLAVPGRIHRMAWRAVGIQSSQQPPWLLLHGGPGSGAQPGLWAAFDLTRQRVIAPDQRAAGASQPRGSVSGNTLGALVADLDALRQHLGIERWALLAGSWGAVLALAYAQRYPQRVERLVLRGAFGVTRREIAAVVLPANTYGKVLGGAVRSEALWPVRRGMALPAALARLAQLFHCGALGAAPSVTALQAARGWQVRELRAALRGLRRALLHAQQQQQPSEAAALRQHYARLQRQQRHVLARLSHPRAHRSDREGIDKFRLQAHYLRHRGFVRPGALDRAVQEVARAGIDIDWIHGRFDAVCPPVHSQRWAALGRKAGGTARLHRPPCGHLGSEAPMLAAVRQCIG